jgi:sugar O-acyltransferase (sialic acid O-acetyltransferase NeuD family)
VSNCAILGASGHGKVLAEIAELNGYHQIDFYDDRYPAIEALEHWDVKGNSQNLRQICRQYSIVIVAIGNNNVRYDKYLMLKSEGANFNPLVHPKAVVSQYATLGECSVVMAGAVVNPFSSIGNACIINTNATVEHDCVLRNGVHISPNGSLSGGVVVGDLTWIGVGASVKQLISIGANAVIGSGATVVSDVSDSLVVVGTPAKPI